MVVPQARRMTFLRSFAGVRPRRVALACAVTLAAFGAGAVPASGDAIAWLPCQRGADDEAGAALDAARAQCATVRVPVDYAQPDGATLDVAISRIRAADAGKRRGVLLVNPGGPGAPGLGLIAPIAKAAPRIASRYDLIGMDPRFVGRSRAIVCDWSTDTYLRGAGRDRRSFAAGVTLARSLAAGCARGNEAVLPHATTTNTARDMDAIRAALGEPQLSYLGVSYGTYLGAVYSQLFGDRVDRFVLDSGVDPRVYGPALLSRSGSAMERALRHWAGWAARHHAQVGLGTRPSRVLAAVRAIRRAAARRPLRVGTTTVDTHALPFVLLSLLTSDDDATYGALAETVRALRRAADGRRAPLPAALGAVLQSLDGGTADATDRAGTPILCADRAAERDQARYLRDIDVHRRSEPTFGPLTRNISPCAFWPTTPIAAPPAIDNAVPALLVGAEGDPLTPLAGQRALHRALRGSRLLSLRGAYTHGAWLEGGSRCIDRAVERYLDGGVLPARDGRCARDRAKP